MMPIGVPDNDTEDVTCDTFGSRKVVTESVEPSADASTSTTSAESSYGEDGPDHPGMLWSQNYNVILS